MKVIDPGHTYSLDCLDAELDAKHALVFVKREGEKYPDNVGHHQGTNIQEILRALIHRLAYLDKQVPHWGNQDVMWQLRCSILILEQRAAERHGRKLPENIDVDKIDEIPTCPKCGHIGCGETCHE